MNWKNIIRKSIYRWQGTGEPIECEIIAKCVDDSQYYALVKFERQYMFTWELDYGMTMISSTLQLDRPIDKKYIGSHCRYVSKFELR